MMVRNACRYLVIVIMFAVMPLDANAKEESMDSRIDELIRKMTLEEKVSLTSGRDAWGTQQIERLGIPHIWMADGPHGLRRAPSTDLWGYGDQAPATCFPTASALSASWDIEPLASTCCLVRA